MSEDKNKPGELIDSHGFTVGVLSNRTGCARVKVKSAAGAVLWEGFLHRVPVAHPSRDDLEYVDVPARGFCPVVKVMQSPVPEIDDGKPVATVFVGDAIVEQRRPVRGG